MTNIALVDDHILVRNGLASIINSFTDVHVMLEADNGQHLIEALQPNSLPDVMLLDVTMPKMDGFETANWMRIHYPEVRILALSVLDNEAAIIRMLKNGARGYLLKNTRPADLKAALESVMLHGYYYNEWVTSRMINALGKWEENREELNDIVKLTERELKYLTLICAEKSHKEIAGLLFVSPRTVDYYRDSLFQKLKIGSKVGLVLYAMKNGIV
jgi:two-component system, NarL family, invasion response regulator UvrY